ncbi:MAG: Gfo/Idh/MocA family protein [Planctomycetota bacterium]|jgi:predicted dehydrogenase
MSTRVNRRRFVGTAVGAAAALGPAVRASGKRPASERVRIGLIGCGGRGRQLLNVMRGFPDVEFPVISDPIEPRMDQTAKLLAEGPSPQEPDRVVEHERLLERDDVDAVLIATTQHWHGLPFIHAARAGKHIFVEKPLSHTVAEGRAMVEAARKAGIIAMMGTQQRGYPHYQKAVEVLRTGRLGKIALVECWNYHNTGKRVGRAGDSDPPPGYHWDRWLGPAPYVPFNKSRLNNSWWFDYAGGMLTNWAVHHVDVILWAMQVGSPGSVACPGGKLVVDDLADTPDTVEASWRFPGFLMHYRYRGFNNFHVVAGRPQHHGICFHGNRATMVLDRSGYEIWEDRDPDKSVEKVDNPRYWGDGKPGNEVDGPWQRLFVDCIRERRKPPVDLEKSHQATACCHLANIAYLTKRTLAWDGQSETFAGDPEASRLLSRPRRKGYELPEV